MEKNGTQEPGPAQQQAKLAPGSAGLKDLSLAKHDFVPPAPSPADFPDSWPAALAPVSGVTFGAGSSGGGSGGGLPVVSQRPAGSGPDFRPYSYKPTLVTHTANAPYLAYFAGATTRYSRPETVASYGTAVPRKTDATAQVRRNPYRPTYAMTKVGARPANTPRTADGAEVVKEVAAFVTQGKDALEKGKYEDAVTAFARAARVKPDDPEIQVVLSRALQMREAQEKKQAVRLVVDDGATRESGLPPGTVSKAARDRARLAFHKAEGHWCLECGRCADAAVEFEAALRVSPGDADATTGLKQAKQGP
jgi:hypothetical protein